MSFDIPALDDSHEMALALAAALLDDPDLSQGSFNWLWFKTNAACVTDNHANIKASFNDLLPDTASVDTTPGNSTSALTRWAGITGKVQKGATGATGNSALRVTGSVGSPVPALSTLVSASQQVYQVIGSWTVGAGGFVDVNIAATSTGSATNLSAGANLQFTNTPSGLNEIAVMNIDITNGTDIEDPEALRGRVLSQLAQPAPPAYGAGKQTDYEQLALQQTGIAAAFAYPNRQGLGSVDVAALHAGSGNARPLLTGEVTALQATMAALVNVGATFRVLSVFTGTVDVDYTVVTDGTAATLFDWNDATPPAVLTWNVLGANVLQFAGGARPSDMAPGDRFSIKPVAGGGDGAELVVNALSGADAIILQTAPVLAPAVGDTVYAGGPLVQPIRAAIQALFDALGTANPDATRYGAWEGNVDPGSIDTVARNIKGVLRGTPVAPAVLVTGSDPAFPNDGTIELLIAGRILVRAQH